MSQILVIDDDIELRNMVCQYLVQNGLAATGAGSVHLADGLFAQRNIALVVLDINMPDEDGLSFLSRLRQRKDNTPVLILSGRAHEADRVRGLQLGADDYLVKPFGPRELLARVQALLRRSVSKSDIPRILIFGAFHFDFDKIALYCGTQELPLSSGERALMKVFAQHPGRTLSRHELLSLLGDEFGERFERSIDVRVTRLRTRLGDTNAHYIRTVRGQGYCFAPS